MPAHEASCPAVGNRLRSAPISASRISAVGCPTPGIVSSCCQFVREGAQPLRDLAAQLGNQVVQGGDVRELAGHQEALVGPDAPGQRPLQLRQLGT
jgi:hypothetical protein